MNQFLSIIMALCFLSACTSTAAAKQTPVNTNCNGSSVIVWDKNAESDMKSYRLYSKTTAGITPSDTVLLTVNHQTAVVVWTNEGKATFRETFKNAWEEGTIWFALSAIDTKGNESILSAEVGCDLDIAPDMPLGITIVYRKILEQYALYFIEG